VIIPATTPRPRLYRCTCGLVGKVRPNAFNVTCKGCGRVFGPPDPPVKQTQEMYRNRRRMEKEAKERTP
jgi:hypothetical protein